MGGGRRETVGSLLTPPPGVSNVRDALTRSPYQAVEDAMATDAAAGSDPAHNSGELRRALHLRHLVMLSVGGTIASGYLLFGGSAISIAGPAVIISFAIAGIIAAAVMCCLAELCVAKPVSSR